MDKASALRAVIIENLHSGAWPAGHRLPTERALSEQFGISRSTVRRTLSKLKSEGLISQRVGSGTYANPPSSLAQVEAVLRGEVLSTSPAELMAARLVGTGHRRAGGAARHAGRFHRHAERACKTKPRPRRLRKRSRSGMPSCMS